METISLSLTENSKECLSSEQAIQLATKALLKETSPRRDVDDD